MFKDSRRHRCMSLSMYCNLLGKNIIYDDIPQTALYHRRLYSMERVTNGFPLLRFLR